MDYVFGLDGGGTGSRLRIADLANAPVSQGENGAINPNAVEPSTVAARLEELFARTLAAAPGTPAPADFAAGCVAVAGMDRPGEKAEMESLLRGRLGFTCPLTLVSDPEAALVGGLGRLDGIILISGTGSIAVARLSDGTRFRAGGYGHFLSDEGSAFSVGFQAIRRVLRSREGRDLPTAMAAELVSFFGLSSTDDFVPFLYRRFDKAAVARVAPVVARYRDGGDALAFEIYREAARELAALVVSVSRAAGDRLTHRELLLWGGHFDHDEWLRTAVARELADALPQFELREAGHDAAYGACMLALELVRS